MVNGGWAPTAFVLYFINIGYLYAYIYTLMVQIKATMNKADVFMVGSFWGGVPKKSRFLAEILQKMRTVL